MSRHVRRSVAAILLLAVTVLPLTPSLGPAVPRQVREVYGGVGAWVDIYDDQGWANPEATVLQMRELGVRTLYLQTCNYRCKEDLHRPTTLSRWIEAAHASGIKVVAWYLPGLEDLALDTRRSLAALGFRTVTGQRFDSFALDIEARLVDPVKKRNKRLMLLSRRIREAAGPGYPLGAITIPWFYDWGGPFPYRALDKVYDVFVPMIYFGYRSRTARGARYHTARNIQQIRQGTGNPSTPVHAIAGIASDLNERETGAFVRTAQRRKAIGVSLYDYFTSGPEDWAKLSLWR